MNNKIYLFTGPIRSGKTTALQHWAASRTDLGGFLTPDGPEGRRVLEDLSTYRTYPFEAGSAENPDTIEVGRFRFYRQGFEEGKAILHRARTAPPTWLIIDEVGKLELRNEGWMPELEALIETYKRTETVGNLLLVVRSSLLEQVVQKFGLKTVPVWMQNDLC